MVRCNAPSEITTSAITLILKVKLILLSDRHDFLINSYHKTQSQNSVFL
ncbi:hypothetical protein ACP6PL_01210 [Dapis sp. BLCC M126]